MHGDLLVYAFLAHMAKPTSTLELSVSRYWGRKFCRRLCHWLYFFVKIKITIQSVPCSFLDVNIENRNA
jgi:hypothetical protein